LLSLWQFPNHVILYFRVEDFFFQWYGAFNAPINSFKIKNMTPQKFAVKPHKPKKRKVHWHLLMIGDNGKVFNFLRYKTFVFLIISIICLSTASAFGLFHLFKNNYRENEILRKSLSEFEIIVDNLKNENEILAARLVMGGMEPSLEEKKTDNQVNDPTLAVLPENLIST
jgi:hypothetical protein